MVKLMPFAIAAAAAAALGACSTPPPPSGTPAPNPKVVTNVHPYKAGQGVVQAVYPAPMTAAAGSTAAPMQRLEIKMSDGSIQYVDTPSREFTKGTRVTLSEDRFIKKS